MRSRDTADRRSLLTGPTFVLDGLLFLAGVLNLPILPGSGDSSIQLLATARSCAGCVPLRALR